MFTNDFQMNAHPFSENPPLDHLLKDQRFAQALAKLDYFTQEGSLALVTAATGLGKTSLLRLFAKKLNPTQFLPVYIHMSNLKGTSLLKIILAAMGEDPPARGKERLFLGILERARLCEQTILFLIDELALSLSNGPALSLSKGPALSLWQRKRCDFLKPVEYQGRPISIFVGSRHSEQIGPGVFILTDLKMGDTHV